MATTAYVVGAQFPWRRGLSEPRHHARAFYGVLAACIGLAFAVTLAKISVIGMLVAASVVGRLGTPIGLVILVVLARDRTVHGHVPHFRQTGRRRLDSYCSSTRRDCSHTSPISNWAAPAANRMPHAAPYQGTDTFVTSYGSSLVYTHSASSMSY
jgi:Mn2+/Fe2+ NRAMP family transporter